MFPPRPTAASLNLRFQLFEPTLQDALVLHQLDDTGEHGREWLPCPAGSWCGHLADRYSASLLLKRLPGQKQGKQTLLPLFQLDKPGFLINTNRAVVSCAYSQDGGTTNKWCDEWAEDCVPGCMMGYDDHGNRRSQNWCDKLQRAEASSTCPYRANQLGEMVEQAVSDRSAGSGIYNEVVIDAQSFVDNLPWSVEAFVFPTGYKDAGPEAEAEARELHEKFVHIYKLTAADVPLMRLDISDLIHPFSDGDRPLAADSYDSEDELGSMYTKHTEAPQGGSGFIDLKSQG